MAVVHGRYWWSNRYGVHSAAIVWSVPRTPPFWPHGAGRFLGESFMYAADNMGIGLRTL